jgi:hypothetical protein
MPDFQDHANSEKQVAVVCMCETGGLHGGQRGKEREKTVGGRERPRQAGRAPGRQGGRVGGEDKSRKQEGGMSRRGCRKKHVFCSPRAEGVDLLSSAP